MLPFAFTVILQFSFLLANAWDVAVVTKEEIEFFRNGTSIGIGHGYLKEMNVAAYDPVHAYLYVSDSVHPNTSIFRVNLRTTREIDPSHLIFEPVASKQSSVQGIAYDPSNSKLYWTTGNGNTILSLAVSESNGPRDAIQHPGTVLHQFDDGSVPRGIAVDSCNSVLYWTNIKPFEATIEKSLLDGSNRTVVVSSKTSNVKLDQPYGLIVDLEMKKLFWCDAIDGSNSYQIVRSDLDGRNAVIVLSHSGHEPYGLSVVGELLYWTDHLQGSLFSISKNSFNQSQPHLVKTYDRMKKLDGIVSNSLYANVDVKSCPQLTNVLPQIKKLGEKEAAVVSHINEDIIQDDRNCSSSQIQCLNDGVFMDDGCRCTRGFTGSRCELSVCHNYCVAGSCHVDELGRPRCDCEQGRSGDRCEQNRCDNTCLNGGRCSIDEKNKSVCKCDFGYLGRHCEFRSSTMKTLCNLYCVMHEHDDESPYPNQPIIRDFRNTIEILSQLSSHVCSCSELEKEETPSEIERSNQLKENGNPDEGSHYEKSGSILLTILLAAGCLLLGSLVVLLTSKLLSARKRPRIRKKIVVNRQIVPSTCRQLPEQCEITIENCCNMNVCETPCFEPEFKPSKPTFVKKKKSEDKKALVSSMYVNSSQDEDN